MVAIKTEITEIVTGLGMLGCADLASALRIRPCPIINVCAATADRLAQQQQSGNYRDLFNISFRNGIHFAKSSDGLRDRPPVRIEWKGQHVAPAYEQIPADLRVDHVYLISCKYKSKIIHNVSPYNFFDYRLTGQQPTSTTDWYIEVAQDSYQRFYSIVRDYIKSGQTLSSMKSGRLLSSSLFDDDYLDLPENVVDLSAGHRSFLKNRLKGRWPASLLPYWRSVSFDVAHRSAERLLAQLFTPSAVEEFVWRLLRLQAAPYFVLGHDDKAGTLRYRVCTPWDFRHRFGRFVKFDCWADREASQPKVCWMVEVDDPSSGLRITRGHVEIRWSHGKFLRAPEAKVYLDTSPDQVSGYHPIV